MTISYFGPRVPIIDIKSGQATPLFYRFLTAFFQMPTDGAIPDQLSDLAPVPAVDGLLVAMSMATDAGALAPPMQQFFIAADDVMPALGALRDQIAMLTAQLDDLKKGALVL